jgi:hypothetical protein
VTYRIDPPDILAAARDPQPFHRSETCRECARLRAEVVRYEADAHAVRKTLGAGQEQTLDAAVDECLRDIIRASRAKDREIEHLVAVAIHGWENARLLAVGYGAHATERVADEELAKLQAALAPPAKEGK